MTPDPVQAGRKLSAEDINPLLDFLARGFTDYHDRAIATNTVRDYIAALQAEQDAESKRGDRWLKKAWDNQIRARKAERQRDELVEALELIASCEKHIDGDVVDIAQKALRRIKEGDGA